MLIINRSRICPPYSVRGSSLTFLLFVWASSNKPGRVFYFFSTNPCLILLSSLLLSGTPFRLLYHMCPCGVKYMITVLSLILKSEQMSLSPSQRQDTRVFSFTKNQNDVLSSVTNIIRRHIEDASQSKEWKKYEQVQQQPSLF